MLFRFRVMLEMFRGESDCVEVASNLTAGPSEVQEVFAELVVDGLAKPVPARLGDSGVHDAYLTPAGKAQVRGWDSVRIRSREKSACMGALLDWLDSNDGRPVGNAGDVIHDVRGHYFGRAFDDEVIRTAARELHDKGLISGLRGGDTVAAPKITTIGQVVLRHHDGDVGAWIASQIGGGDTFNIHHSSAFALSSRSPNAHQWVQTSTDAADQLRNLAAALEEMTSVLGLEPIDLARAHGLVGQLREAADLVDVEPERAQRLLAAVKAIAINGAGSAAGTALVALVDAVASSI
jgi:hypothetical protein